MLPRTIGCLIAAVKRSSGRSPAAEHSRARKMNRFGSGLLIGIKNKQSKTAHRPATSKLRRTLARGCCMSVAFDYRARLELVSRAAVGTLGFAVMIEFEEDARMRRPQGHGRIGAI